MKRIFLSAISLFTAIAFALIPLGQVSAMHPFPTLPDPKVTPVSGDGTYTYDLVNISRLPGTVALGNEEYSVAGYPDKEKQFGGSGVKISGLEKDSLSACFALKGVSSGWGGQVAKWTGSAWKMLPTTISTPDESSYSWACATVNEDGTYAFIKWIVDASLLPTVQACPFTLLQWWFEIPEDFSFTATTQSGHLTTLYVQSEADLTGRSVTMSLVIQGGGTYYTWDGVIHGTLEPFPDLGEGYYRLIADQPVFFMIDSNNPISPFHFRFDFGSCVIESSRLN